MDGIQKTVALALRKMADDVEQGKYGEDDDFDPEPFEADVEDDVFLVDE